jgi:hypothetical protein
MAEMIVIAVGLSLVALGLMIRRATILRARALQRMRQQRRGGRHG